MSRSNNTNRAAGGGGGSQSTSARSKSRQHSARAAQTSLDAQLHAEFEKPAGQFDYSASTSLGGGAPSSSAPQPHRQQVSAYLKTIQRGQHIQPFGCLLAVSSDSLSVLAYSHNAPEMLDLMPHAVPSLESLSQPPIPLGSDVRSLFRSQSASALQKAASFPQVSLINPILVHSRSSGKPFYAILHRIDVGLIIDLEPVNPSDVPVTAAGALKSYKLAAKAISRLQSLPSGNISLLCDVLAKEVRDLTGYDRVMTYKFHEDEHGEVIAECKSSELEPYLGLHYPATDIPQASRFLFMKNKVRIICDCHAPPVKVIQDEKLGQPISLCGSTLRAPHGCHAQYMANMGSIASLVMSVTINEEEEEQADKDKDKDKGGSSSDQQQNPSNYNTNRRKLWGLVVCHHSTPRFVPFPLRYACEFLLQVFGIQLNKELELAVQAKERNILRTQTLLCDMLLRDAPIGIFTQSPNVMDLVKCDGAALFYKNQLWLLGSTPDEIQIKNIVSWLNEFHDSSTGLSTDSLMEAGYPNASTLGDIVCGMAAIKISNKGFIFWFRSHTAKEIQWGGAKHEPSDKDEDARKMHPRSSFKAFLEVVKWRSLSWEDVEMDAIHSLQLILRGSLKEEDVNNKNNINEDRNNKLKTIVKANSNSNSFDEKRIEGLDELRTVTNEMVRLIETANVPILAVDSAGNVNGWNSKAADVTGLSVQEAVGTPFLNLVLDESVEDAKRIISSALQGKEEKNVEIKLKTFNHLIEKGPVILIINACCSRDISDKLVGVCFIAHDITTEKTILDKYTKIQGDYVSIVRNPSQLIPPIFIIDESGSCLEWNESMQKLSGFRREDSIGRLLIGEVFTLHSFGCRLKDHNTLTKLNILVNSALSGQDVEKLIFGFYSVSGKYIEALINVNKRVNSDGEITGALCFLHVASPEMTHALNVQKLAEQAANNSLKELVYVRQEVRKPLNGMMFMRTLLQDSHFNEEQKGIFKKNILCQQQLAKVLDDLDLESIEQGYMELNTVEFNLLTTLNTVLTQGMSLSQERRIPLEHDWPRDLSNMSLYGDNLRLQQILADFLNCTLQFSRPNDGPVILRVISTREQIGTGVQIVHLEFRIIHPAPGVPEALIQEMFQHSEGVSREGLGLYINQKIVKIMNGTVHYQREAERAAFVVLVEFPLVQPKGKRVIR